MYEANSDDGPSPPQRRLSRTLTFRVTLPRETMERIEALADASGMFRTHFYVAAVMLGVSSLNATIPDRLRPNGPWQ